MQETRAFTADTWYTQTFSTSTELAAGYKPFRPLGDPGVEVLLLRAFTRSVGGPERDSHFQ
jgi:hypothetical protein